MNLTIEQSQRFWSKVEKTNYCWNWTACKNKQGYGKFALNGKTVKPHRISYELFKGKFPVGKVTDHLCNNPSCLNPLHLEAVTQKENVKRGLLGKIIHWNTKKTHCLNGHLLESSNILKTDDGARRCKICKRERQQIRRKNIQVFLKFRQIFNQENQ